MFKNPFEVKNENSIIENMFNVIKEFCYRKNNQHDANLIDSMNTLMKANFNQFANIFPNMKIDIIRNYDKKDKDFLNAYFKVIEDQIAQHHVEEVVNDIDVQDIEKLQENISLSPEQIKAADELKKIIEKERDEESFKDEVEHFVDATKDLISYPMHKHQDISAKKVNLQNELNSQIDKSNDVSKDEYHNNNDNNSVMNSDFQKDKTVVNNSNISDDSSNNSNNSNFKENSNTNLEQQSNLQNDKITNPIVNLILSQLKDVVTMMNQLSDKMQEIEKNNLTAVDQLGDMTENVKNYNDRIETLENNIEKFIGLYEVFMNEYNPFLDKEKK